CRTTACFCAGWGRACWNWEGKAARSATPWCIPGLTWNTCSGWATKRPAYTPDAVISRHALTPADIRPAYTPDAVISRHALTPAYIRRSFCRLRPRSRSGAEASARSGHRRLVRSGDGATGRHESRSRGPATRRKGRSGGGGHHERAGAGEPAAGGAASYAGG